MNKFVKAVSNNKAAIARHAIIIGVGVIAVTVTDSLFNVKPTEEAALLVDKAAKATIKAAEAVVKAAE